MVLGIQPDAFIVAGIVLTGIFTILVSISALNHMGRFMDLEEDRSRSRALAMFWFPPLVLGGALSLAFSLSLPPDELAYPFLNSAILLLMIVTSIILVPMFTEPRKEADHRLELRTIGAVTLCFVLVMAGWAGIFGLSKETAHGILLHDPPVEVEVFYSDYSIGNAEITVMSNGTAMVNITLRNCMESPSPLEERIYRTFDTRPEWGRYMNRSRSMVSAMFDLPKEVGENLTFTAGFGTARAPGVEDDLGRRCTTFVRLADAGTRQFHVSPGTLTPQPGMGLPAGDFEMGFVDPWMYQGGYLDEVRVSWDAGLELVYYAASSGNSTIDYNWGSISLDSIGWENADAESSPTEFSFTFNYAQ
jgi:hypothetical protein